MSEQDHTYYTVGENRGAARVYLQGLTLEQRGFAVGTRYRREPDLQNKVIRLIADPNGKLKVVGKEKAKGANEYWPVIDVNNKELEAVTEGAAEVRVDFDDGVITMSVAHLRRQQRIREERFKAELKENRISEGTLCAGAGMATLALHEGFARHGIAMETRWIVDREKKYLQLAVDNNPAVTKKTRVITGRMEEIEPNVLSQVSICQFSLSCRGHSPSGKSKRKIKQAESHPEDSTGILGLARLMDAINPAIWISENVRAARESASYEMLRNMLKLLNYRVVEFELNNQQSGSFENRERYWLVGVSEGLSEFDPAQIPTYPKTYQRLADLIDPIDDNDPMWSDNSYLKAKAQKDAEKGSGFAKRQLLDPETATSCGVINRLYHKRQSTPPYIVNKAGKERLFTLAEQARAKSCTPDLVRWASFTTGTEALGQGIDQRQAEGIAEAIVRCLMRQPATIETFPQRVNEEGQWALAI